MEIVEYLIYTHTCLLDAELQSVARLVDLTDPSEWCVYMHFMLVHPAHTHAPEAPTP